MPRPSKIVAVMRLTQAIGISSRRLAPTLPATAAPVHKPSVAPANTRNGSYLAARFAVVSCVISPHSATNTTPKLVAATRQNEGARPPWRTPRTTGTGCSGSAMRTSTYPGAQPGTRGRTRSRSLRRTARGFPPVGQPAGIRAESPAGCAQQPKVSSTTTVARWPGACVRRYVGQPTKDYSPSPTEYPVSPTPHRTIWQVARPPRHRRRSAVRPALRQYLLGGRRHGFFVVVQPLGGDEAD